MENKSQVCDQIDWYCRWYEVLVCFVNSSSYSELRCLCDRGNILDAGRQNVFVIKVWGANMIVTQTIPS